MLEIELMKFSVLAVDFDGTIATNNAVDQDVRRAIAELRTEGIVVALVTGRSLDDLRRLAGGLHFVDAVVAENGAVVEFPDSGYSTLLASPPPPEFLKALTAEAIRYTASKVVVDADAADAPRILSVIRQTQLPLVLAFNRGRVMVLPQAISKATGLLQALAILRLSVHNALAIGDAENDHELLRACEVGVAVGWGSEALKAVADHVLAGDSPAAVAGYIRALASGRRLPIPLKTRRLLTLGHTADGRALSLAVRGRNILVAGDPKSGKSWVTGLLCEQLILYGYALCVIDPEGDYVSLGALPGVTVIGGADPLPRPRDLVRRLAHADSSLVIDLSHCSHAEKLAYVHNLLPSLATLRRQTGLPHRIVLDEAHYFLHGRDASVLLDLELNGHTLVSYQASKLDPAVLAASQAILMTRESDPAEVRALSARCESCPGGESTAAWVTTLSGLTVGEAVLLPIADEASGSMQRIRLAPRLTPHVRHQAKYVDIPVQESRGFVFRPDEGHAGRRARTLRDFVAVLEGSELTAFDGHLRRGDFSRWISDVFGDYPLGNRIREIEDEYRRGRLRDIIGDIAFAIRTRYEFVDQFPDAARDVPMRSETGDASATPALTPTT